MNDNFNSVFRDENPSYSIKKNYLVYDFTLYLENNMFHHTIAVSDTAVVW